MEDDTFVESKWSEAKGKKVPRKYYQITEKGKVALSDLEKLWQEISGGVETILKER